MYNYLPGMQVQTVDGGLKATINPSAQSVVVIGTAGQGEADTVYQVLDRPTAAAAFGFNGTLIRGMEEAATYCDNIYLFRMGTVASVVAGVGTQTGSSPMPGLTLTLNGDRSTNCNNNYRIFFGNGILGVWNSQALVNCTDPNNLVDDGSVTVSGTVAAGSGLNIGTANTWAGAVAVSALASYPTAMPASITGTVQGPFTVVTGTSDHLTLTVGGVDQTTITLAGGSQTASAIAQAINTALGTKVLAADNGSGKLTISTLATGTAATLQVKAASTTCATLLGLPTTSVTGSAANANTPLPVLTAGTDGLGMNVRDTYIAQQNAFDLLDIFPVQHVHVPNCVLNANNVSLGGNPVTDPTCLDWLCTTIAADGHKVFQWASSATDSDGNNNPINQTAWANSYINRQSAGFFEVNFGYQLARFCAGQSAVNANEGGCLGYIGCTGPASFNLPDLRTWIGKLPTMDPSGTFVTITGVGLLGIPYLSGAAQSSLNALCADKSTGRAPGFFQNDAGEYDGGASYDTNGMPIDIGAYIHVCGDWGYLQNGYGNYTGNIAGLVCGFVSNQDPKESPTNKPVVSVVQRYKSHNAQLDALTQVRVNMLRFRDVNDQPRLLHGYTMAMPASDYTNLIRQRIKFLVCQNTEQIADPFIGSSTTDGLQMSALKTALDKEYTQMKKDGYLSYYRFNITSTLAQQKIGQATITITFNPANELVQLIAVVGLTNQLS